MLLDSATTQPPATPPPRIELNNHNSNHSPFEMTTYLSKTTESVIPTPDGTVRVRPYRSSSNAQLKAVLSFTPRVSSLDRHNTKSQSDEFRGFFVLFWIGELASCLTQALLMDDRPGSTVPADVIAVMGGESDPAIMELRSPHHPRRPRPRPFGHTHDGRHVPLRTFRTGSSTSVVQLLLRRHHNSAYLPDYVSGSRDLVGVSSAVVLGSVGLPRAP